MSEAHAITDEQIIAAWGNPDDLYGADLREAVGQIREAVEMAGDAPATVWLIEDHLEARVLSIDVASVRDRLGGWPAVWRAVLVDEGFKPVVQTDAYSAWGMLGLRMPLFVEWRPAGWTLLAAISIPLRSPADLRVRVGHAKGLFAT